ncbi:MAG: helix-turn-helix transcriptional regulator [Sphingomonadales bacterium]|nr:helix-turn-helix transcriptional regulator [Sphingomonadales bacterium]
MNKVQAFTTPSGEEMVILPRAEYERMVEELEDIHDAALAEEILARIRSGEEEVFPAELVYRLLDGDENPVHVMRTYRGLTTAALAKKAGISRPYLTMIESGRRTGTADVMKRLAKALAIDMELLIPTP